MNLDSDFFPSIFSCFRAWPGTSMMGQPGHQDGPTLNKRHRAGPGLVVRHDGPVGLGHLGLGPGSPFGHLYGQYDLVTEQLR
jgi:hypothetical protein